MVFSQDVNKLLTTASNITATIWLQEYSKDYLESNMTKIHKTNGKEC